MTYAESEEFFVIPETAGKTQIWIALSVCVLSAIMKAIHASKDKGAAHEKARAVIVKMEAKKLR